MSDLIRLRNVSTSEAGDEGGDGEPIGEGIDTENPKALSSRNMSAAALRKYAACLALGLANKQLDLARNIYTHYKNISNRDCGHFATIRGALNTQYNNQHYCAMSLAKTGVAHAVGRKLADSLASTDMYSAGIKRSFIERSYAEIIEESAPSVALIYRDEYNKEDRSYIENRTNLVASIDRGNMYVAAGALQKVANTQIDLGLYMADQRNTRTLNNIDNVVKLVNDLGNLKKVYDDYQLRAKTEAPSGTPDRYVGNSDSNQFGEAAPVRPDNPGGYTPVSAGGSGGVVGNNVNVGGGAASIPSGTPTFTTGR